MVQAENTQALAAAQKEIRRQERERAETNAALEHDDLRNQVAEATARNTEFQQRELELRRGKRELEVQIEQEILRRERMKDELLAQIRAQEQERFGAKIRALEEEKVRMTAEISELQRKHETGSRQQEGHARHVLYGEELVSRFRQDRIVSIRRGQAGADIDQTVVDDHYGDCGGILHEVKDAQRWDPKWPIKLAADKEKAGCHFAVLVSSVLPPGEEGRCWLPDVGVWVVDFTNALTLICALRATLIELAHHRRSDAARADAAERTYDYLTTGDFAQRVLSLGQDLTAQQASLDKERTAMTSIWQTQEKTIDRSWITLAAMIGDLEGLGAQLPTDVRFEFPLLPPAMGPGPDAA
jgi:hypothetical protein